MYRRKLEADKVRSVMADNPTFKKLVQEDAALAKYIESHPNNVDTPENGIYFTIGEEHVNHIVSELHGLL